MKPVYCPIIGVAGSWQGDVFQYERGSSRWLLLINIATRYCVGGEVEKGKDGLANTLKLVKTDLNFKSDYR